VKFSVMNLILLTIIAAMAAQLVRNHFRAIEQQLLVEQYQAIHAQTLIVQQRELDLKAKVQNRLPELRNSSLIAQLGLGQGTLLDSTSVDKLLDAVVNVPPTMIDGNRVFAEIRNAKLHVLKANLELQQLEVDLKKQLGERVNGTD